MRSSKVSVMSGIRYLDENNLNMRHKRQKIANREINIPIGETASQTLETKKRLTKGQNIKSKLETSPLTRAKSKLGAPHSLINGN